MASNNLDRHSLETCLQTTLKNQRTLDFAEKYDRDARAPQKRDHDERQLHKRGHQSAEQKADHGGNVEPRKKKKLEKKKTLGGRARANRFKGRPTLLSPLDSAPFDDVSGRGEVLSGALAIHNQ